MPSIIINKVIGEGAMLPNNILAQSRRYLSQKLIPSSHDNARHKLPFWCRKESFFDDHYWLLFSKLDHPISLIGDIRGRVSKQYTSRLI
jgi:hypothetical protein